MTFPFTRAHFESFRFQAWRKLSSRRIPCLLCGSRKTSLVYKSANVHMAGFREVFAERVEKCETCGFVFTNPRLPARALEKYYTKNYRLEGLPIPKSVEQFLSEEYREIWFSKQRDLNVVLGAKSHGRLLDIGCASGTLLWLARQKGFDVEGVEVSKGSAEFANDILGIDVFCGQLEDAHFANAHFDVVTMFHALEHVPEPRKVLREIRRILSDDGVFIAVVPNFASWSARKQKANWKWLQPENHYSHFTPETISALAEREGFAPSMSTEEGRYGAEYIRQAYAAEEIPRIYAELKGSEIILVGRKTRTNNSTKPALSPPVSAAR
jgi:2-polyprenyl-3-methyl-5-hydroxy-6-metoxy-1,4-benzoquinol methylase